ncbi:PD-(D/E)XK nuclease family protein [Halosolutus gelatinilyticus]|uniref:PD-(D/E)XK nuclease family protein n=1 Tax=Halosolutus gelatinilyticus TaxID=2931975 RepID=UPI001FF34885|nr:PD-(D/E)XK nuclease family protein [Halosolutus gelatinilyticus]
MASDAPAETAGERSEPIDLAEVETYLRCPRRHQYEHRRRIHTATRRDAVAARTAIYRAVITAALDRWSAAAPDRSTLRETATAALYEHLDGASIFEGRPGTSRQRRYDEATVRTAVENYVDERGEAHAESAIAIGETYAYAAGGETLACPVDLFREADGGYEIVRFVTTLDGVVWEDPYSDPVADYRSGEGFYPREVGSVLRAYATIHAVAAAHDVSAHNVRFRYYAIAQETYPAHDAGGRNPRPEVVAADRNVTDPCWDAGSECETLLREVATSVAARDWDPADRWDAIAARSCRDCKYRSMCLDYINEEVRF